MTQNQHSESTKALPCVQTPVSRTRFVPMLFSTPMVQAILNGTKTETRRIINPQPENYQPSSIISNCNFKNGNFCFKHKIFDNPDRFEITDLMKSKVNVGDIIWVRETFVNKENIFFKYADVAPVWQREWKWKPSLFMPKKACRLFLEVLDIKIEKLHQIDEQSAIDEGIELAPFSNEYYKDYNGAGYFQKAVNSYYSLWNKINGKDSHKINPWVWVYRFRSVPVPPDFC